MDEVHEGLVDRSRSRTWSIKREVFATSLFSFPTLLFVNFWLPCVALVTPDHPICKLWMWCKTICTAFHFNFFSFFLAPRCLGLDFKSKFFRFSTISFTTVIRSLGQLSLNILVYIPLSSGCKEVILQMSTWYTGLSWSRKLGPRKPTENKWGSWIARIARQSAAPPLQLWHLIVPSDCLPSLLAAAFLSRAYLAPGNTLKMHLNRFAMRCNLIQNAIVFHNCFKKQLNISITVIGTLSLYRKFQIAVDVFHLRIDCTHRMPNVRVSQPTPNLIAQPSHNLTIAKAKVLTHSKSAQSWKNSFAPFGIYLGCHILIFLIFGLR